MAMRYRWKALILFFFPVILSAQQMKPDSVPFPDTIPGGKILQKGSGVVTYKTEIDTVKTLVINELLAINAGGLHDDQEDDDDWFEIYNYGDEAVRINNLYFTDDPAFPFKWKFDVPEERLLEKDQHLLIWADGEPEEGYNHSNFRLSAEGEYLAITAGDGTLIDQVYFGPQQANVSYGRYPDGSLTWNFFTHPTPESPNTEPGVEIALPLPTSNIAGGNYTEPVSMALYSGTTGAKIYFTEDCTEPDTSDFLYRGPIDISTTTIIRARSVKEDAVDSPVLTISVLMDQPDFDNPLLSLVAEPEALYGNNGLISKNNSSIEVTAHMEYIEGGETLFSTGTGMQLHAPKSSKPNSLRLSARSRYGTSWFDYPFFNKRGPAQFKRLILRNSGNDDINKATTNTHFRDPLIQTLAEQSNTNPMISESKPLNIFLNGSFYGLFNLREKQDEYYIETHTGETENYDFIELEFGFYGNRHVIKGSYDSWEDLLSFVDTTGNLSRDADYHLLEQMVDLDNFTDYWITEVFAGNYDWISNNVKFWKPLNGKWKWIYWDTDHGLGLQYYNYGDVSWNTLFWSLTFSDRAWSNGYNNILIRNLLLNEEYKAFFIKRFTQLLSTSLSFNNTKPVLDSMKTLYQNDLAIHAQRWDRSMTDWENACDNVENYLRQRPDTVLNHIRDFFELLDPVPVTIRIEPPGAGTISFSGLEISDRPFRGMFFPGMEYELQLDIIPTFTLDRSTPVHLSSEPIEFQLTDSLEITAYCLPADHSYPIQITEVYSNNRTAYDTGDWIEFYYYGRDTIQMEDWYITGDENRLLYTFGENSVIHPGQRFIVVEDIDRFSEIFIDPVACFGNMNQSFPNHSALHLYSEEDELLLAVELMDSADWPVLPEEGFSLELKTITDDATDGAHWELSQNRFGSPGLPNSSFYNFHTPSGKDSVFSNDETRLLVFNSSGGYYSDDDQHMMSGISIKQITGPGQFYRDNSRIVTGTMYEPGEIVFEPHEPLSSATRLVYSVIDKSGQESSDYSIWFNPALRTHSSHREVFRLYPVPSSDFCTIEIPEGHAGPIEFFLFDLNGKLLQSLHTTYAISELNIDLTGVESGIYLYLIKTGLSVVNGKIEVIK
jgi:hypothetical protein